MSNNSMTEPAPIVSENFLEKIPTKHLVELPALRIIVLYPTHCWASAGDSSDETYKKLLRWACSMGVGQARVASNRVTILENREILGRYQIDNFP